MKKFSHKYICFYLLLFFLFPLLSYSAPVEPTHPVYDYLQRIAIKFDLPAFYLNTRPLQKQDIQGALKAIESVSVELNQWEREKFHYYRREFFTTSRKEISKLIYQKDERELIGSSSFHLMFFSQDSLPVSQQYGLAHLQLNIEGKLFSQLGFVSSVTFAQERALEAQYAEHYQAWRGLPYNTPEKADSKKDHYSLETYDAFRMVLCYQKEQYTLEVGNDWNQWGPGIWQHPSFAQNSWAWVQDSLEVKNAFESEQNFNPDSTRYYHHAQARRGYRSPGERAPLVMVRGTANWEFLKYSKFIGQRTGLSYDHSSHITGHRLEVGWKNFSVGVYEMLVFSRENMEWTYALPFVSLFIAEHMTGDRDNVAMGLDMQIILWNKLRLYAELFLDDMVSPLSLFEDYWGNKSAISVGGELIDPFVDNTVLQFEYARVEPWVYSHHVYDNQFQQLGNTMGSLLPPNAHMVNIRWRLDLLPGYFVSAAYRFYQHQHLDKGSSLFDVHELDDPETKNFLGQGPETRHDITTRFGYHWSHYIKTSCLTGYQYTDNWRSAEGMSLEGMLLGAEVQLRY
ncbi:MAG: hypothetical protein HQK83_00675 [Fibrobacteria bacterium]|nr:hypothetical protein [Fibrobacteria bacterium]